MNFTYCIYDPCLHFREVEGLWQTTLGETFPVTRRVLWPRIAGRNTLEAGDGWVALQGKEVVGFVIAEIDRASLVPLPHVCIQTLIVHPAFQRQGVGTELLRRLEQHAEESGFKTIVPGIGPWRFWPGVPDVAPAATAFFLKSGYVRNYDCVDLYIDLRTYSPGVQVDEYLGQQDIKVISVTQQNLGMVYDFLAREQPSWFKSMMMMVEAGDKDHVLVFTHGAECVGCIQTYTPVSRFRGTNLVWEARYGGQLGGFGAVLIAHAWRGKGLGAVLCHVAATHIKKWGASGCYIDWTSEKLASQLYAKVGAPVCMSYGMYSKEA